MVNGLVGDVQDLQPEVVQLRQALATRAPIDQAKGILMMHYGLHGDAAFRLLVRWSSLSHVKLRVVAQTLVDLVAGTEPSRNDPPTVDAEPEAAETGPQPVSLPRSFLATHHQGSHLSTATTASCARRPT